MKKSYLALIVCWLAACEGSSEKLGTESHFLESCKKTAECGSLQCIEGRCTKQCDSDEECDALEAEAFCRMDDGANRCWVGDTSFDPSAGDAGGMTNGQEGDASRNTAGTDGSDDDAGSSSGRGGEAQGGNGASQGLGGNSSAGNGGNGGAVAGASNGGNGGNDAMGGSDAMGGNAAAGSGGIGSGGGASGGLGGGAGADAGPRLTMCSLETFGGFEAAGCFCQGAIAVNDNVLYRQSYGIEVFDVSNLSAPVLLDTIEETGVSDGAIVVFDGYLVSVANVNLELNVYSLVSPTAPTFLDTLTLPGSSAGSGTPAELATRDGLLAVAYRNTDDSSVVHMISLDGLGSPSIERSLDVDGRITSMTLADGVAHLLVELGAGTSVQELRQIDLTDGTVVARFDTDAAGISGQSVREWRGNSFLSGGSAPALAVVEWTGSEGALIGRWDDADTTPAVSLEFLAPDLLAVSGGVFGDTARVSIVDVFDATNPRLLGAIATARVAHLAIDDNVIFTSGNDALLAHVSACE